MNETKSFFTAERVTDHITRIRGCIGENMYLVEGNEKALLIDTGCGIGNIAEYVKTLTEKPLAVVLTHNHYDHCGGMYHFSEAYLNQNEWEPNTVSYTEEKGREILDEIGCSDESAITAIKEITLLNLEPGTIFDLGDTTVEAILCPGHTVATMCFLILPERLLLTGDACHQITYLQFPEALPLSVFAKNLETLKKRETEWDSLLLCHFPDEAPKTLVTDMQKLCQELLKLSREELKNFAESEDAEHPLLTIKYNDESHTIVYAALKDMSAEILLK